MITILQNIFLTVFITVNLKISYFFLVLLVLNEFESDKNDVKAVSYIDNGFEFPIVRLYNKDYGSYCTAFVISPTTALTAAHCVVDFLTFYPAQNLFISDIQDIVEYPVKVAFYNKKSDVAILIGDMSFFSKVEIANISEVEFDQGISCGYANAIDLLCLKIDITTALTTTIVGINNQLIPGMSGGPLIVLDKKDNKYKVIGINSAMWLGTYSLFGNIEFHQSIINKWSEL
ncbi:MAG: serine protease [Bacteroidia bacterium]|nr:serine protease [Bacteroidia bacterium]